MYLLEGLYHGLERVSRVAVWLGGLALMICAVMVTVDVLARKFLGMTMSGSDEISGYVFAAGTTWAYSYCLLHRSNIRIDALYNFLPAWARAALDVLGLALLLLFMWHMTDKSIDVFLTSWQYDSVAITTLATRLWIPQLFWVAGLVLFVFTLIVVLLYTVLSLLRRDLATERRIAGVLTIHEEIAEETHGIDAVAAGKESEV